MTIISVPKERKTLEKRVALTPQYAKELVDLGHTVIIEKDAGIGSFFSNQDYIDAGCQIAETLEETWAKADLLLKVKEPDPDEYPFFREDLIIFDFLHLADFPELAKALMKAKTTSIAYELVQTDDGHLPLLEPMSIVAGKLAVQNGANALLTQHGGRGVLLGGTKKVAPGTISIIGAGTAGSSALGVAVGRGAKVNLVDINEDKLAKYKSNYPDISTYISNPENILKISKETDLMILAVLIPGAKAPKVLSTEHVKAMPKGSVLIDISIDQGGAAETIKATSLAKPTYVLHDVIHYGVPNMPSQVARTATEALTKATLPYIKLLANNSLEDCLKNPAIANAVNTKAGKVVNEVVSKALDC